MPNVPKEWKNGTLKGVTLKGNLLVDVSWENGNIKTGTIRRKSGKSCLNKIEVSYKGIVRDGRISGNELDLLNILPSTVE